MRAKPDWLDVKRYDFAKTLDAEGWYDALTRRIRYRDLWEREPSKDDSPEEHESFQAMRADPEKFFQDYLDYVLPLPKESSSVEGIRQYIASKLAKSPRITVQKLWTSIPLVDEGKRPRVVGKYKLYRTRRQGGASKRQIRLVQRSRDSDQSEALTYASFRSLVKTIRAQRQERRLRPPAVVELKADDEPWPIHFELSSNARRLNLIIDLEADDATIIKDFGSWLHKQERGPLQLPGKRGLHDTYSQTAHGSHWHEHRILAVMDIEMWCRVFNKPKVSAECLADWLMPEEDENGESTTTLKESGRTARRNLDRALSALDALAYASSWRK